MLSTEHQQAPSIRHADKSLKLDTFSAKCSVLLFGRLKKAVVALATNTFIVNLALTCSTRTLFKTLQALLKAHQSDCGTLYAGASPLLRH